MVNPKCVMCNTYISKVELKSSGEPYKTCNRCRGLRKNKYKKPSINKADENDEEIEDRRKFNTIRNIVEIDNFIDKFLKDKCIPRPELKRKIERCLEHTFTTKKNECDVCGTIVFVPDSESD